ncbi:MAG: protein phosphatase 2C domain-containing protein [Betaproteobacteria bacterium]|nr:protein phosphatase 2C domain-containing protein [Betaproteobacteria bacterium]
MAVRSKIEIASATDAGLVRSFNEDSLAYDEALGLCVLADGMGGYKAGDVASSMATRLVLEEFAAITRHEGDAGGEEDGLSAPGAALKRAIERANGAIHRAAQSDKSCQGMGATVAAVIFHGPRAAVAHVGDSRVYRYRDGDLALLTHDHSLLQEQVGLGLITPEDAKLSHNRNLVTRALGVGHQVKVDVREEGAQVGDIYLLCSDGLNDMVDDADIGLVLAELNANLPLAASQLVQIANDNGGHDNVSVLIAQVGARPRPARGWWRQLFSSFGIA